MAYFYEFGIFVMRGDVHGIIDCLGRKEVEEFNSAGDFVLMGKEL